MHILEQYALSCGLKIGKPFMYDHFFPLAEKRYITIQREAKSPSKQYKYWQQVVDLLHPILSKKDISIVQIGGPKDVSLKKVTNTNGKTSIRQAYYLIRNSELHLGIDSFATHIASSLGKKIVALYSNMKPENSGPYWTSREDCVLIQSPIGDRKVSYAANENPKTIDNIKPESVANSVLKLLGFEDGVKIETLFIGEHFDGEMNFGFLANQVVASDNGFPELRLDLLLEEKHLPAQLSKQKSTITTNKPLSQELLIKFKANIAKIIYLIEENDNPEFVKFLFENGFAFDCVSRLLPNELSKKKVNYYRYCSIHEHAASEAERKFKLSLNKDSDLNRVRFKTNYIVCSDRKNYLSEQRLLEGDTVDDINAFHPLKITDLYSGDFKNVWVIKELY